MDLVNKYLKLSEAWPGTPEWKKKHDPNYNPYDPEGKARKALKQQPYGYRGKSAEGEEEEKPAEQPAMKKRGRPKKVREDVQVDEAAAEKTYNYAFDKVRDMDAKNPFSKSAKRTMYTKAARNAFQRMKSSGTKPNLPEEVEQVDELKTSTLNSYIAKRQGNTANRMAHAMRKLKGKPSKHDVYNTGLKRAQQKIDAKREKETGMNPQKPRPAAAPAYPLGGYDPKSNRSYSEEVELDEMDKSQPSSSRGAEGLPLGKKADPVKTDKVKSDALKALQKQYKKVKEEVEIEEGIGGAIAGGIGQFIGNKIDPLHGEILRTHGEMAGRAAEYTIRKHLNKLHKALKSHLSSGNATNEEVEQVDELSKSTLASYAKKASHDARIKMATGKDFERISKTSKKPAYKASAKEWEDKYKSDARRREAGVNKAIDRLAKEEVEQVDEISAVTHAKYRQAARADIRTQSKNLDVDSKASDRIQKRVAGLARSTGLERAKKMNEQEYETVPASKALQKAHDEERKKRGLPDPSYYLKLAAQKKKEIEDMKKNEETAPPFKADKPKKQAVAGKYGPEYSTARHLARMGLKAAIKDLKKGPEKGSKQV